MSRLFPAQGIDVARTEPVPDGAVRLDALHNIGATEGTHVWRYEPGHPMTFAFATIVDPAELSDESLCEQMFALLNIGHDPADVGMDEAPDPRALAYRERGNRSLSVGDAVAVTRGGQQTVFYAVATLGFTQIDLPSIVNEPGYGTVPLD